MPLISDLWRTRRAPRDVALSLTSSRGGGLRGPLGREDERRGGRLERHGLLRAQPAVPGDAAIPAEAARAGAPGPEMGGPTRPTGRAAPPAQGRAAALPGGRRAEEQVAAPRGLRRPRLLGELRPL